MNLITLIPWGIGFVVLVAGIFALMARQQKTPEYKTNMKIQNDQKTQLLLNKQAVRNNNRTETQNLKINYILHAILLLLIASYITLLLKSQDHYQSLTRQDVLMMAVCFMFYISIAIIWVLESLWKPYRGVYKKIWNISLAGRFLASSFIVITLNDVLIIKKQWPDYGTIPSTVLFQGIDKTTSLVFTMICFVITCILLIQLYVLFVLRFRHRNV